MNYADVPTEIGFVTVFCLGILSLQSERPRTSKFRWRSLSKFTFRVSLCGVSYYFITLSTITIPQFVEFLFRDLLNFHSVICWQYHGIRDHPGFVTALIPPVARRLQADIIARNRSSESFSVWTNPRTASSRSVFCMYLENFPQFRLGKSSFAQTSPAKHVYDGKVVVQFPVFRSGIGHGRI